MVRIKHRYLLIEILTPQNLPTPTTTASTKSLTTSPDSSTTAHHLLPLHTPTPDTITPSTLLTTIRTSLTLLFGDHGTALAGPTLSIKYWSNATSTFILRCKREVLGWVWGAICFVSSITVSVPRGPKEEMQVVMRVVRVSGTVRKCEEEAVRRAKGLCGRVRGVGVAVQGGLSRWGVGGGGDGEEGDRELVEEEEDVFGESERGGSDDSEDEDDDMELG